MRQTTKLWDAICEYIFYANQSSYNTIYGFNVPSE